VLYIGAFLNTADGKFSVSNNTETSSTINLVKTQKAKLRSTVEPGYNNIGLYDTLLI
jgi:hypothetical protein